MRKFLTFTAPLLFVATMFGYLACSGQTRQVVVGSNSATAASGETPAGGPYAQVGHSAWDALLRKYVDTDGMVNYAAWKASEADQAALRSYLAALSRAEPDAESSRESALAFWINAYNALTVHGILEVYPTSSIRNHTAVAFGYNIWKDLLLPVGNRKVSLNDIEHEILRTMDEPRIHFAIVCASIGCPRLLNEAYTAERLEEQLVLNTRDFFSRRQNFQADPADRRVRVSSILDWFGEDFASTPQKALASLAEYMPDEASRQLASSEDFTVSFLDYDWDLNEQ